MTDTGTDTVLDVVGLTVTTSAGTPIVQDVTFSIKAGEVVASLGESGSGKTMTALAVMGLQPPDVTVAAGRIVFAGADVRAKPARARRAMLGGGIAMVFQDATAALDPRMTIGAQMVETLELHTPLRGRAALAHAVALLGEVGLPEPERLTRRRPHQLSGGMNQRVMIAQALAGNPRLLIADEPTSALDATTARAILDTLRRATRDRQMAMLLITHDIAVAALMADRVMVMTGGRVVEHGTMAAVARAPSHPLTQALLAAARVGDDTLISGDSGNSGDSGAPAS